MGLRGVPRVNNIRTRSCNQQGLSLIELMVAVVIGLIVIGGLTSIVVATLRTNNDNVQMTRLTQDLRAVMQLVTRDIRRAGYWPLAIEELGTGISTNPHDTLTFYSGGSVDDPLDGLDADCVEYSYHLDDPMNLSLKDDEREADEQKGFRYDSENDLIEVKTSGAASCTEDSDDWDPLTDSNESERVFEITEFSFATVGGNPFPAADDVTIREIVIAVEGRLVDDPAVTRRIEETIRVRNDQIN